MKILKRGVAPTEKKAQVTCHVCKSELEYTQKDLVPSPGRHPLESDYQLICPVCLTDLTVEALR